MKSILKNIDREKALKLADLVAVQHGQVVSKTLLQNDAVSITVFAFDKGEEIGAHDSDGDAMATVLEGSGLFVVGGREHALKAGETIIMPAGVPHSIFATEPFKWFLVVAFPRETKR